MKGMKLLTVTVLLALSVACKPTKGFDRWTGNARGYINTKEYMALMERQTKALESIALNLDVIRALQPSKVEK